MRSATTVVCFVFMLIFALPVAAQDEQTIALHPLKGDSPEVAGRFLDEIAQVLSEFPGPYVPYLINLEDDETIDIISGGLPAYICPNPILTKDATYAITGEVIRTSDFYTIRLYLWDMTSRVALISDELIVDAEDETRYLPQLLAWMLSWIDREKPVTPPEVITEIITAEPEYWLSVGLRIGGGDSAWYFNTFVDSIKREYATHFLSGNVALQGTVHLLSWLALQTELNLGIDISQPWNKDATEGTFVSSYLTIPLLIKFNWRSGNLKASLFPGVYYYLPLSKTDNDKLGNRFEYKPNPPGFLFGGNVGWKLGPGFLFVDGRFEYDGVFWEPAPSDRTFYRNTVKLSLGYEMNFLKKKKKQKTDTSWATVTQVDGVEEQGQDWEQNQEQEQEQAEEQEQEEQEEQEQEQEQLPVQEQISSEDEPVEVSEPSESL